MTATMILTKTLAGEARAMDARRMRTTTMTGTTTTTTTKTNTTATRRGRRPHMEPPQLAPVQAKWFAPVPSKRHTRGRLATGRLPRPGAPPRRLAEQLPRRARPEGDATLQLLH